MDSTLKYFCVKNPIIECLEKENSIKVKNHILEDLKKMKNLINLLNNEDSTFIQAMIKGKWIL